MGKDKLLNDVSFTRAVHLSLYQPLLQALVSEGFNVIDFRVYLVLMTGGIAQLPKALTGEEQGMDTQRHVENTARSSLLVPFSHMSEEPFSGRSQLFERMRRSH